MSFVGTLIASQIRAGQPLRIFYTAVANAQGDDNYSFAGVGTTTAATPPTTMANFAHSDYAEWHHALLGNGPCSEDFRILNALDGGSYLKFSDRIAYSGASKVLDSNYAAGKYLWAFMTMDDPSVGGTALLALGGPYHIR